MVPIFGDLWPKLIFYCHRSWNFTFNKPFPNFFLDNVLKLPSQSRSCALSCNLLLQFIDSKILLLFVSDPSSGIRCNSSGFELQILSSRQISEERQTDFRSKWCNWNVLNSLIDGSIKMKTFTGHTRLFPILSIQN